MNFTDDSGEEIKCFSKTEIEQSKHLETVKTTTIFACNFPAVLPRNGSAFVFLSVLNHCI